MRRVLTAGLEWIRLATICGALFGMAGEALAACSATWTPGGSSTLYNTCPTVGVGTSSPSTLYSLHVYSATTGIIAVRGAGTQDLMSGSIRFGNDVGDDQALIFVAGSGYTFQGGPKSFNIFQRTAFPMTFSTNSVERLRIDGSGNVGIATASPDPAFKLHVAGSVRVDGNIAAKYQDVAEWVTGRGALGAGTVVILDSEHSNAVVPSLSAYDTRVAGVVSEKPGVILGESGEGKSMIATTGRVRMKVDASRGPVRAGDLLVTSDREGFAMKSEPVEVAGVAFHRPGTLVGKALEPLESGQRQILVLLSLQ